MLTGVPDKNNLRFMFEKKDSKFSRKDFKEIEKTAEAFFTKMCFSVQTKAGFDEDTLKIEVKSDEPRVLIGEEGRILACIQRLLKAIFQRQFDREFYFNVDINDYKKKKFLYLQELAEETANKVALSKQEKELEPMSSYERRVIHLQLAGRPDITTESIGIGPGRRVVIKPFLE